MNFLEVTPNLVPISLLLEADPSKENIKSYLSTSWCFAAQENDLIIGACIVKTMEKNTAEILNVSVMPQMQAKGIGSQLLKFVINQLIKKAVSRIELGTGTFGYQLIYYQRLGFRVDSVVKDYFLKNYTDPIFENGIQLKDMLRLYLDL